MQVYDPSPELGLWVRKQRTAKEQGTLPEERLRILLEMGFEFGEEANITEEWEWRFDLLVELLLLRVGPLLGLLSLIWWDIDSRNSIETPLQEVQAIVQFCKAVHMLSLFLLCQRRAWRLCIL